MHLKIQKLNKSLIDRSLSFFDKDYINELKKKSTFNESIVSRYLIEDLKNIYWYNNKYISISHKKDLVFVWISDKNFWLDIEIIKNRDNSVYDLFTDAEYNCLWWKILDNFYLLWTAKESLIKMLNLNLDDMKYIFLRENKIINQSISWINFKFENILVFNWEKYVVKSGKKSNLVYSLVY